MWLQVAGVIYNEEDAGLEILPRQKPEKIGSTVYFTTSASHGMAKFL